MSKRVRPGSPGPVHPGPHIGRLLGRRRHQICLPVVCCGDGDRVAPLRQRGQVTAVYAVIGGDIAACRDRIQIFKSRN